MPVQAFTFRSDLGCAHSVMYCATAMLHSSHLSYLHLFVLGGLGFYQCSQPSVTSVPSLDLSTCVPCGARAVLCALWRQHEITCVPCGAKAVLCALWRQRGSTCVPCGARAVLRALWRQQHVCV